MRILSLDYNPEDSSNMKGHFELNGVFGQFACFDGEVDIKLSRDEFKSIEHYAGVFGKFNPYTVFLVDPPEIDHLTFEELWRIRHHFPTGGDWL